MWPRVEFIWLPISPGIKYLYLALVTAGFLSELQRLCPQTHVGNESAHSRLELSPRCAHCKKYPPERVHSAGFHWTNVQDEVFKCKRQNPRIEMNGVVFIFGANQSDWRESASEIRKLFVFIPCECFLVGSRKITPKGSIISSVQSSFSSYYPTWFSSMKQKVHTTFLGEICPNWTFFAARTPSRCASTALTCTQFMGSKPQQTASCLSLTIPCYFLFVFAEHMCKNSPFHLCWSLNYTDFFFHLFIFYSLFLGAPLHTDATVQGRSYTAESDIPSNELDLLISSL